MGALAFLLPVLASLACYHGWRTVATQGLVLPLPARLPVADLDPSRLPQPSPLEGPYAPNAKLRAARRLYEGRVQGSESVAVKPDGSLFLLDKFGYLHIEAPDEKGTLGLLPAAAYVGPGRPLGFHFSQTGDLIICDSLKGLVKLGREGGLVVLANQVSDESPLDPGTPITYANDLDFLADGRVLFSDSTAIPPALNRGGWYDTMRSYLLSMWQGGATGRLLVYAPATGEATVLAGGLWYANGVAVAPDESFVAVVETCSMRVRRYWLKGEKAGTVDTLIDRLPGFPDGITRSSDGNFWLCILVPDLPVARRLLPHKLLRWAAAWAPQALMPKLPEWGMVVKVSPTGQVLDTLMDPDGSQVSHVSSVTEFQGRLYLGNLAKDYVSVYDLGGEAPQQAQQQQQPQHGEEGAAAAASAE